MFVQEEGSPADGRADGTSEIAGIWLGARQAPSTPKMQSDALVDAVETG